MKHQVAIATYPGLVLAWLIDLPGCVAGAAGNDALAVPLGLAIAEHVGWLAAHGEPIESSGDWEIVEVVEGAAHAAVGGEFCFEAEKSPVSDAALDALLARMAFARADLLASTGNLARPVLDWVPPRSAFDAFDAWAPEARSIRGVLDHVLRFEPYYRDGLRDGPAAGVFEPAAHPGDERAASVAMFRSLPHADRARVFRPVRPGRHLPEEWTLRKVVRRIISHERVHAAEILQRRTWVLLGTPDKSAR